MTIKSLQEASGLVKGDEIQDLKSLRESRGLTLDDVYQATKISLTNLEAIENGDFRCLPAPVFSRGYLQAYAKMVNIDVGPLIGRYEKYMAIASQAVKAENEELPKKKRYLSHKFGLRAAIPLVICALGLFIYGYFYLQEVPVAVDTISLGHAPGQPAKDVQNLVPPVKPASDAPAPVEKAEAENVNIQAQEKAPELTLPTSAAKAEAPKKGASGPQATVPVRPGAAVLIIKAREKTWLRIREGDSPAYQLLMKPGERIERSASQYTLDIGNAGGVSVEYQGKVINELGKSGEVVHLRLP